MTMKKITVTFEPKDFSQAYKILADIQYRSPDAVQSVAFGEDDVIEVGGDGDVLKRVISDLDARMSREES